MNDSGVLLVRFNAIKELWYWHWPDGDIPEAPQLSSSYLVGPHLVLYNMQQTLPVMQRENGQSYYIHVGVHITVGQRL